MRKFVIAVLATVSAALIVLAIALLVMGMPSRAFTCALGAYIPTRVLAKVLGC